MSAATVRMTPCPRWCGEHYGAEDQGLGAHYADRVETPVASLLPSVHFNQDGSEHAREIVLEVTTPDGLTPQQARELAAELVRLADLVEND